MPRGLPRSSFLTSTSSGDNLAVIGIAAVALLLIGFSQTAGDARAFATRHHYRIDVNQESVAQGMANVGAGVFQGMPVSTSLSASSLNESAGARTPVASLATGGLVVATLVFLAPLFSTLPKAVLGAIIIDAVVFGMIDVPELRRLYRVTRFDFWIAVAAILGVLSAGVLAGVVIGVVLSLGWLVYVATQPPMPLLGREAGTQVFRDLVEHPDDETVPGIAVLRLDGGLFFATAEALDNRVRELVDAETVAGARARPRGRQLHRLTGLGEALRDRPGHGRGRDDPAPRAREAARARRARGRRAGRATGPGPHPRQRPSRGRGPARLEGSVEDVKVSAQLAALAAALALAAGCGGSDDEGASTTAATTATTAVTTVVTATTVAPTTVAIDVVGGKPKGGIVRPKVRKDAEVVVVVHSDTADEVHIHGYDISKDVAAGGTARIPFIANVAGRFEIELEGTGVQLAELTVQ